MDFLAPPQPEFDIEATMQTLKIDPASIRSASCRWKVFDAEPKDQPGKEDAVFKLLPYVFNKIVDTLISNSNTKLTARDRSVKFFQNPNMAPMSADRHNATRPDGYMLAKDMFQEGTVSWADVLLRVSTSERKGLRNWTM
jgi:hypothetical protein